MLAVHYRCWRYGNDVFRQMGPRVITGGLNHVPIVGLKEFGPTIGRADFQSVVRIARCRKSRMRGIFRTKTIGIGDADDFLDRSRLVAKAPAVPVRTHPAQRSLDATLAIILQIRIELRHELIGTDARPVPETEEPVP